MNRYWSESGIGFVLTTEKSINEKSEIQFIVEALRYGSPRDMAWDMSESGCHYYDDNNADGKFFTPFDETKSFDAEPKEMLVFEAKKQPEPFKTVYPGGIDEMRKEFQEIIGKYFPDGFDWDAHIGYFNASVYV